MRMMRAYVCCESAERLGDKRGRRHHLTGVWVGQEELRTGWLASVAESPKQTQIWHASQEKLRLGFAWDLVLRPALFLRPLSFPPARRPHTPYLPAIMRPSPSLLKRSRIKLPTRSNIFANDHYDQPLVPLRAVRLPFFSSPFSPSPSPPLF